MAVVLAGGEGERLSHPVRASAPSPPCRSRASTGSSTSRSRNCVNSDIDDVLVLTQYNPRSLNDHIGAGRPWDLDRNTGGVRMMQPYIARSRAARVVSRHGRRRAPEHPRPSDESGADIVLILAGDHIYKMDYGPFIQQHRRKRADVTIAVKHVPIGEAHRFGILALDDNDAVTEWQEKPKQPKSDLASLGIYVFSKRALARLAGGGPRTTSARNVIPAMLDGGARVFGYRFDGYWQDVGTVDSYWQTQMELLDDHPPLDLYDRDWVIHTRSEERRAGAHRADRERPPQPHQPRLPHRGHGRALGAVAGRARRPGRHRARQRDHVRRRHPRRRRGRPRHPRQGGLASDRTRSSARATTSTTPNNQEPDAAQHRHHARGQARDHPGRRRASGATCASARTSARPTSRRGPSRAAAASSRVPRARRRATPTRRAEARRSPVADGRARAAVAATRMSVVPRPRRSTAGSRELGLGADRARRARRHHQLGPASSTGGAAHDIRVTLILDPALALLCWVHYAPPINDSFRVSYRKLLRWNDELPFVKFAARDDERPVLTAELPARRLDRDALGIALARLLAVCDLLLDESVRWLWPGRQSARRCPSERDVAARGAAGSLSRGSSAELTATRATRRGTPEPRPAGLVHSRPSDGVWPPRTGTRRRLMERAVHAAPPPVARRPHRRLRGRLLRARGGDPRARRASTLSWSWRSSRARRASSAASTRPRSCWPTCWRTRPPDEAVVEALDRRRPVRAQGGRAPHPGAATAHFGLYETAILGMLAQSTGWATAARECVEAAAPEPVISFGARHVHPHITDALDYAAIVGGCVGASTPAGARLAGLAPTGTMPHSLVLVFGDTVRAAEAFDRHVDPDVPRIVLVDTFRTRRRRPCASRSALGDRLYGVRLDTPVERGRVTADLVREVRARLDQADFAHVRIIVSGRPDARSASAYFKEAGAPVDFVRGRQLHQRRHAHRLHGRPQGDRRSRPREARTHPGPDAEPASRPRRPEGLALGLVLPTGSSPRSASRSSHRRPTSDFASSIAPAVARATASRQGSRSRRRRSSGSGPE